MFCLKTLLGNKLINLKNKQMYYKRFLNMVFLLFYLNLLDSYNFICELWTERLFLSVYNVIYIDTFHLKHTYQYILYINDSGAKQSYFLWMSNVPDRDVIIP